MKPNIMFTVCVLWAATLLSIISACLIFGEGNRTQNLETARNIGSIVNAAWLFGLVLYANPVRFARFIMNKGRHVK